MTDAAGVRTDLSFMARIGQAVSYVLTGVKPAAWFGPMQPPRPMAPEDVTGRRFDYHTGYNLLQVPRGQENISFAQLRGLAESCDVLRSVIQTRIDQVCAQSWTIRVKVPKGSKKRIKPTPEQESRIEAITAFMASPDREGTFETFTRAILEDHFVIDAPFVYKRPDNGGKLYALEYIDGGTIIPLIDDGGRRPLPPDAAYEQILKGVPAVQYAANQAYYMAQNVRSNRIYGYAKVEQVAMTVNIAIRRALFNLEYYDSGTTPDGLASLPVGWDLKQIKKFQEWFDSLLSGQLGKRRKLRFMPGEFKYQETKAPPFKDEYDDYLTRVICFVFSVSPNSLVKGMNRAVSESQHDEAIAEGLVPTNNWYGGWWTRVINEDFESPDLEFAWDDDREVDPKTQMEIDTGYAGKGIRTIDEIRDRLGEEAFGGLAAEPLVLTASGYQTLGSQVSVDEGGTKEPEPVLAPGAPGNGPRAAGGPAGGSGSPAKLHKGKPAPGPRAKKAVMAKALKSMKKKLVDGFKHMAPHVAAQLASRATKAAGDDGIDLSLLDIVVASTASDMASVTASAATVALARVGVTSNAELVNQISERSADWAAEHAAELVGKRIVDGEIIENPNAKYRIDQTTRDMLQSIITNGLEDGLTKDEMYQAILDSTVFSEERAELIARTEIGNANSAGALVGYKTARDEAGVSLKKVWLVDGDPCPICLDNEADGAIDLDEDFSSGDDAPLAHPNCECALIPIVEQADGSEDEE